MILKALIAFFPTEATGIGSVNYSPEIRKKLAKESRVWECTVCKESLLKELLERGEEQKMKEEKIEEVQEVKIEEEKKEPVKEEEKKEENQAPVAPISVPVRPRPNQCLSQVLNVLIFITFIFIQMILIRKFLKS